MHPQDVFPNQRQCPEPLLPHSTGENLGRQHLFPCSSPTQSLCLHFTGRGNNNWKKKKKLYPSCKFHFWLLFLPPPGREGRAGQGCLAIPAAAHSARSVLCPQRTPGPAPERRALPLHRVPSEDLLCLFMF